MDNDPDDTMTNDEFEQGMTDGLPVEVVTSRAAFEAARWPVVAVIVGRSCNIGEGEPTVLTRGMAAPPWAVSSSREPATAAK